MKLISKDKLEFINNDTVCVQGPESKAYWKLLESHLALYKKYEELERKVHPKCDCELDNFIELVL